MSRYPELKGKVALITGAGRAGGLGEGIARRLAAEGCRVVVTDIGHVRGAEMPASAVGSNEALEQVAAAIVAEGGDCTAITLDVLEEAQVQAAIADVVARFGGLDILVNNAGIGYLMKPIIEMEASEWDAVLGVNLRGGFLCMKHAAKAMIAQGRGGRIVNIASQAAKSAFPFASAYCSSKHGLVGLTRVGAVELGQHGITVNAICPNHVTTGLGAWQNEYFAKAQGVSVEEYLAAMRKRIPLGRPGLPDDTAAACAFLCSDDANYVTGEAMNVSGGEENH
ncbi:SDR family NAD(P)-dependent oxidoreductase [Rhodanobacter sp. AS-Z3]|uniref:SDR family NAD(P)-dependent oxidoreductase n=1 Tax=Rhodanobacter sp. AS-Z3 TaxID=3031330 RepID=UPI00247A814B|nr:SDR family NAD(P)-dependent oxidoreductase [Rhodanobacter sp. AS-Z3]WEN14117.1 SDR family NAD(P)-dependent oxidoreductase [Rhodanobacter sp. AS-Z3]